MQERCQSLVGALHAAHRLKIVTMRSDYSDAASPVLVEPQLIRMPMLVAQVAGTGKTSLNVYSHVILRLRHETIRSCSEAQAEALSTLLRL